MFFISVVTILIYLCFLTFSIVFPKTELLINLKKCFCNWVLRLFLILFSCQYMYLIMVIDYNGLLYIPFLVLVHGLMLSLELFCGQHKFSFSFILQASLLHFLFFVRSCKNGISRRKLAKYSGYLTSTSRIYPSLLSSS